MDKKKKGLTIGLSLAAVCLVVLGVAIGFAVQEKKENTPVLAPTDDNHIRVATFNLAAYDHPKMKKVSAQLNAYGVDVVGFQEVDKFTKRNNLDMMGKLAECGVYAYSDFQKCFDYEGGEYGIGMASKTEIVDRRGTLLRQKGETEDMAWEMIEIKKGGRTVHVYNTHFDWLSREKRRAQMMEMLHIMDRDRCAYKILTGDFNVDQDYRENDPFLKNYNMANGYDGKWMDTFNEKDPNMKVYAVDNIIMTRNLRLVDANVHYNKKLSDHSMFYAEFEFLDEPEPSRQLLDLYIADAKAMSNPESELKAALFLAERLRANATQVEINLATEALERALLDD